MIFFKNNLSVKDQKHWLATKGHRTALFVKFKEHMIFCEFYNGSLSLEFSASMLKENIALVRDYVSEARK